MTESAFLTREEVARICKGVKRHKEQCDILTAKRIPYIRAGRHNDGEPLVLRSAVDADGKPAHRRGSENRWDLIGPKASVRNLRP